MSMNGDALGLSMLAAYNGVPAQQDDIDSLGDHIYAEWQEEYALLMGQNYPDLQSSAINEDWGKRMARRLAKSILTWQFDNPGTTAENRFKAMGNAIVDHIADNATIAPLSTSATTIGSGNPCGPHTHNTSTVSSTGKIS